MIIMIHVVIIICNTDINEIIQSSFYEEKCELKNTSVLYVQQISKLSNI